MRAEIEAAVVASESKLKELSDAIAVLSCEPVGDTSSQEDLADRYRAILGLEFPYRELFLVPQARLAVLVPELMADTSCDHLAPGTTLHELLEGNRTLAAQSVQHVAQFNHLRNESLDRFVLWLKPVPAPGRETVLDSVYGGAYSNQTQPDLYGEAYLAPRRYRAEELGIATRYAPRMPHGDYVLLAEVEPWGADLIRRATLLRDAAAAWKKYYGDTINPRVIFPVLPDSVVKEYFPRFA